MRNNVINDLGIWKNLGKGAEIEKKGQKESEYEKKRGAIRTEKISEFHFTVMSSVCSMKRHPASERMITKSFGL